MVSPLESVRSFHIAFGLKHRTLPTLPSRSEREARIAFLREEFEEYLAAEKDDDLISVADALADMLYIIYGTAVSYGIPLDRVFDEVHASNMSKLGLDGKPLVREDGKVIKGHSYFQPDIKKILGV